MDQNELLEKMSAATTRQDALNLFNTVYKGIDQILSSGFENSSTFLEGVAKRADKMEPLLAMSCFRLTWLCRELIPGWATSCDLVHEAFVARGLNADEILQGLRD